MSVVVITGSAGLVGSESALWFHQQGLEVAGIDNDSRAAYFGSEASTAGRRAQLEAQLPHYRHYSFDIRDRDRILSLFGRLGKSVKAIVHTAAQPSHDWGARQPVVDYEVNAVGTLNLLEATRRHCPEAVFIYTSTNKVYGDTPNRLPLIEQETRWELDPAHPCYAGIDESMSIDHSQHSIMGASKLAADVMVQEYGRYFGMPTACFRCGCLTGPAHAGTELHGFLAYLMKCTVKGTPYRVFGYQGKQVRDNIHSQDLTAAFWEFFRQPRPGEVYNLGGSRHAHCSVREAIQLCETISGQKLTWTYVDDPRRGDHCWYISDVRRFQSHYPGWRYRFGLQDMLEDIHAALRT